MQVCAAISVATAIFAPDMCRGESPQRAPAFTLDQAHHTAWRAADGAPSPVLALAQTADGWMWVGTPTGLFRFDGVRFERVNSLGGRRLPSEGVMSLAAGASGGLWIGYLLGGVSQWREGRLIHHGAAEGLPLTSVRNIALNRRGEAWISAWRGLYRFDGRAWHHAAPEYDLVGDVLIDRHDNVWFTSRGRLLVWPAGAPAPREVGAAYSDDYSGLREGPDGSVWSFDRSVGLRRFGPEGERPVSSATPRQPLEPVLFTRDGGAWYLQDGAIRRADAASWLPARGGSPPSPDTGRAFSTADGLSGDNAMPMAMLQDREGSVWVGTLGGLDRFRPNRVWRMPMPKMSMPVTVAPAGGSSVWVSRWEQPLLLTGPTPQEWPGVQRVVGMHRAPDRSLWAAGPRGNLWHLVDGRVAEVAGPPAMAGTGAQSLGVDAAHRLWVSGRGGTFCRESDGTWTNWAGRDGFPPAQYQASVIHRDESGRLWFAYHMGMLAVFDGQHARTFQSGAGPDVGGTRALATRGNRLWIGGEFGVQLYRDGRFHTLRGEGDTGFHSVSGIVERDGGELWLHGAEGATRIAADDVARFLADPGHRPRFERFDQRDGLLGVPSQVRLLPTLVQADDGVLWFTTLSGAYALNPDRIVRNPTPPRVVIQALWEGDVRVDASAARHAVLPPHTTKLQIEYTALSPQMADRVRFRYRLDGAEDEWHEAGTRRTAYYTNLAPGDYRFRVMAANHDGVWSSADAVFEFSIEPAFHQTLVFRWACGAALVALAALAYRLRMRQLAAKAVERLRLRQIERERIAGELHDTLLQGFYAVQLSVQAALDRINVPGVREMLEQAMARSERLVEAGRERVSGLRRTSMSIGSLPLALQRAADELARSQTVPVTVAVSGPVQAVPLEKAEELFFIASEAMSNAVRHAGASRIDVVLEATPDWLLLLVQDDGRGMSAQQLASTGLDGHWGLRGMRERAQRIGGMLRVDSRPGNGTTVTVNLPSRPSQTSRDESADGKIIAS